MQQINQIWQEHATHKIARASKLAELERHFGYVGFIHHFKNYVIRRNDQYYDEAIKSHKSVSQSLKELKAITEAASDLKYIDKLEQTLALYYNNLLIIKRQPSGLSVDELDKLVLVDDRSANDALIKLRQKLGGSLQDQIAQSTIKVNDQKNKSVIWALLLIPILLIASLFTIYLVNMLVKLSSQYKSIYSICPDAILLSDKKGKIIQSNEAASKMFGYSKKEFSQLTIEDLMDKELRESHKTYRNTFTQSKQSRQMRSLGSTIKGLTKQGKRIELSIAISTSLMNNEMFSVCAIRDITEQAMLKKQATLDHLTNLYNRRALDDVIEVEIQRSERENTPLSLMLIDIDNFKHINDKLGHAVGDEAIKLVASQLQKEVRGYDSVGRWGGDEFMILSPGLNANDAHQFAQRVCRVIHKESAKAPFNVTVSIGVATLSIDNYVSATVLLEQADLALFKAKEAGRNQTAHAKETELN
ncbi:sensor domain-containing diguanylate cyclase [Psychromonas sp. psych-6C06]|uniref:sensor domain-containing diguanylate cyclase n=1 Tax=Psychromonas sp. psych-6C06 TaxID=2058089 RepID=UPI00187C707A|nr:sensor domain-containing diguanylate cyclase [Psychromonas sp. psych-6C06]